MLGLVSGLAGPLFGADLLTIREIREQYYLANGGLANLQSLTSVAASGIARYPEGAEMSFKRYLKRYGMLRAQVDAESGRLITILNKEGAYQSFENRLGAVREMEVSRRELIHLRSEAVIGGPFFQLRNQVDHMSVEGALMMDGVPVYEILVDPDLDSPYERIWVHQLDFYVVKLLRWLPEDDGGVTEEEVFLSSHEQINGVWMAKEIEYVRNGEFVQSVLFDSLRGNAGLFDSFFSKPR